MNVSSWYEGLASIHFLSLGTRGALSSFIAGYQLIPPTAEVVVFISLLEMARVRQWRDFMETDWCMAGAIMSMSVQ